MNKVKMVMLFLIAKILLTSTVSLGQCNVSSLNLSTSNLTSAGAPNLWRIVAISNAVNNNLTDGAAIPTAIPPLNLPTNAIASNISGISYSAPSTWASPGSQLSAIQQSQLYSITFERTFNVCTQDCFTFSNINYLSDGSPTSITIDDIPIPGFVAPGIVNTWFAATTINNFTRVLAPGSHKLTITICDWGTANLFNTNQLYLNFNGTISSSAPSNTALLSDNSTCTCPCQNTITSNGITNTSNTIQLGAACGTSNNAFTTNREIKMNDKNLYFNSHESGKIYLGANSCQQLQSRLTLNSTGLITATNSYTTPAPSTSGLRFESINSTVTPISNTSGGVLSLDGDGDVIWVKDNATIGISSSCATVNAIPKTTNANGSLECSQIYDNGISVSIGSAVGLIGNSFSYTIPLAGQNTLAGTILPQVPPTGNVRLDVRGVTRSTIFLAPSDSNYKMNFKKITNASEIIRRLQAKTFDWNDKAKREINADNGRHIGYIAQELQNVVPEIVIKDENNHYAVNYTELIPVVTESQKELLQQFDELKKQNAKLEDDIKTLKAQNALILEAIGNAKNINQESSTKNSSFKVFPNPASEKIYIEHNIGFSYNTASIVLRDNSGKTIKVAIIDCESPCTSSIEIPSNFSNGNLICSLEVDGKVLFAETIIINTNNR